MLIVRRNCNPFNEIRTLVFSCKGQEWMNLNAKFEVNYFSWKEFSKQKNKRVTLLQKQEGWQSLLKNACHPFWHDKLRNNLLQHNSCLFSVFHFNNWYHSSCQSRLLMRCRLRGDLCLLWLPRCWQQDVCNSFLFVFSECSQLTILWIFWYGSN